MRRTLALFALAMVFSGCKEALKSMDASDVRVIRGRASIGPIRSADVTAYSLWPDGARRAVLSQAMTGPTGLFVLTLEPYSGPIELVVTHGYYLEVATLTLVTLTNVELRARIAQLGTFGAEMSITPLTEFAVSRADQLVLDGLSLQDAISVANAKASLAAGLDSLALTPADPGATLQNPSSAESKYAAFLAGISQEATDNGSNSLVLGQTLSNDFADGKFDGGSWNAISLAINKFINSVANSAGFTSASETVLISEP